MEILSLLAVAFIILARRNSVSDIDMFAPPVFMMLILVFAFDHGWISRMLKRTIYLGKISYSIYLNHVPVIGLLMVLDIKGPFFLPAVYVVTLIVSHFSYQYIEKPCRTRVRRFGDFLERELGQS
jgi:peptidoglycan/LPS O-acetylase OafA/YrhL